ncbi:MAG: DUF4440 domain-containing protein [Flavobacteriaceae bacterium]|nr:DUF4440 domain-containing protein [Flavobacteriaceae bacterium]
MFRRIFVFLFSLTCFHNTYSQNILSEQDKKSILSVMNNQEIAWNQGKIDDFMEGYIKSENLIFNGANGPYYGWKAVKYRYFRSYPSKEKMGVLTFKVSDLFGLSSNLALMIGEYNLLYPSKCFRIFKKFKSCQDMTSNGFFTLLWKKTDQGWLILSDHTSSSN